MVAEAGEAVLQEVAGVLRPVQEDAVHVPVDCLIASRSLARPSARTRGLLRQPCPATIRSPTEPSTRRGRSPAAPVPWPLPNVCPPGARRVGSMGRLGFRRRGRAPGAVDDGPHDVKLQFRRGQRRRRVRHVGPDGGVRRVRGVAAHPELALAPERPVEQAGLAADVQGRLARAFARPERARRRRGWARWRWRPRRRCCPGRGQAPRPGPRPASARRQAGASPPPSPPTSVAPHDAAGAPSLRPPAHVRPWRTWRCSA